MQRLISAPQSTNNPFKLQIIQQLDQNKYNQTLNPCHARFILGNRKIYLHILLSSQHWDCVDSWNPSLWRSRTNFPYIFNAMYADDLATQGAKTSVTMASSKSSQNTVYSRYIAVGGVQAMVPRYKWERDISGDCHEPKSRPSFPARYERW